MRALSLAVCVVVFCASAAFADHELTGTWAGSVTFTTNCKNGKTYTSTGAISLLLAQSGNAFSGAAVVEFHELNEECQPVGKFTVGLPISGTLSGSSFGGTLVFDEVVTVSGMVSGNSMTVSIGAGEGSGSASLTRTSATAPSGSLSGTYSGGFTMAINCPNGNFSESGTMAGSLLQTADVVTGVITVASSAHVDRDQTGKCFMHMVATSEPILFSARVSGSNIAGFVAAVGEGIHDDSDSEPIDFVGTISGNTISATGGDSEGTLQFTISRTSTTLTPAIASFEADPRTIRAGQSATLSWATLNATSVSIDQGIGVRPTSGSVTVSPTQTTTYTLTATGAGGSVKEETTVTVEAVGTGASVVVKRLPAGMLELAGSGAATDVFTVVNIGSSPATLTATPNGGFFTVSPNSFTLPPGGTIDVSLRSTSPPPNTYNGSVALSGSGVPPGLTIPVRLLVTSPPAGPVTARAVEHRGEVGAPAGQNPTGSVSFTNTGSVTLQGIAVADVPWIIPQSGPITIAPGQTQQVSFQIDRSKRPDAGNLVGGATGKITLRFFSGAISKGIVETNSTTVTSNVSVSLVDVVRPNVTPGSPQPLAAGEVAFFVTGLSTRAGNFGDLLLSHGGSTPATDLRLFFAAANTPAQQLVLPQLAPNIPVAFPSIGKTVFGSTGQVGSLQVRGSSASSVSVSAVQVASSGTGSYGTGLPILRSDRAAASGQRLVLAGLARSGSLTSNIYIQEVSGNPATFQVEFFDGGGTLLSTRPPDSIPAFGFLELTDVPVSGVFSSARISNTSTAGARIAAYGLVKVSGESSDSWVVTDTTQQPGGSFVVPMVASVPPGATEVTRVLYLTNGATSSVDASLRAVAAVSSRRRASGAGGGAGPSTNTLNVRPMETKPVSATSSGYISVSVPAGSVSINGRVTSTSASGRTFGTGTNAIPVTSGITSGQTKRFAGVEDASASTVASGTTGTYRSTAVLIETAGESATVRLTLRFDFAAGTTTTAQGVSSQDFALLPNQMLVIGDLSRTIIGAGRDRLGDLRNMQLDVQVIGGSGRVVSLVQSVDNGTGDTIQRE